MLHINSNALESEMLKVYNLTTECPSSIDTLEELADFVVKETNHLIPEKIRTMIEGAWNQEGSKFTGSSLKKIIVKDLRDHILVNSIMVSECKMGERVTVDNKFLRSILENSLDTRLSKIQTKISIKELLYDLDGNGDFLSLKSGNCPKCISSMIGYVAINYGSHTFLKGGKRDHLDSIIKKEQGKWEETIKHTSNMIEKTKLEKDKDLETNSLTKELNERFHINYYNNFVSVLNSMEDPNKSINLLLFEREYNLGLASEISRIGNDAIKMIPVEVKNEEKYWGKYTDLLCVTALLPNINGRTLLARLIHSYLLTCESSKRLVLLQDMMKSIIQMAVITIPVMESYFIRLESERNFRNIKADSFIKEAKAEAEAIIDVKPSYSLNNRVGVLDPNFIKMKRILEVIGKIDKIYKNDLMHVYKDPYKYLVNNGGNIDKFDIYLDESRGLIPDISDATTEKFDFWNYSIY
ncbi:hypothetical protein [Paenibacillus sp. FSL K6-2524]|uniref:hypothetical protein n=1 Tax=Paenibacillus sp. FSL K6-2524 TaxID=2954516 RepID=UPI0030FCEA4A